MYTIIRTYTGEGADELFTEMEALQAEVRDLISGVPGFIRYTAFRTGDGGTTVTACEDKAGTDESSRRAAEFVQGAHFRQGRPPQRHGRRRGPAVLSARSGPPGSVSTRRAAYGCIEAS